VAAHLGEPGKHRLDGDSARRSNLQPERRLVRVKARQERGHRIFLIEAIPIEAVPVESDLVEPALDAGAAAAGGCGFIAELK
jgi:hypothetical protein